MPTPRLARTPSPTLDRFTRDEVLRMVGITPQQITRWERLRLVEPQAGGEPAEKVYTFADLVSLRTLKQLTGQGTSYAVFCLKKKKDLKPVEHAGTLAGAYP